MPSIRPSPEVATAAIHRDEHPVAGPRDAINDAGLSWYSGSVAGAWDTFWNPWPRKAGPVWAHLLLMLLFNASIGLFITASLVGFLGVSFWPVFLSAMERAQFIGFSIMAMIGLGQRLVGRVNADAMTTPVAVVFYGILSLIGLFIGFAIDGLLRNQEFSRGWLALTWTQWVNSIAVSLVISTVIYLLVSTSSRAQKARAEAAIERERVVVAEKWATESQLKLLQAQIEPHFLFNTLANVVGLIDRRPIDARRMLEDFIDYLRGSLDVTRTVQTTVGAEIRLMQSYLSIFRQRMGDRLEVTIDVPEDLQDRPIAPMLIQPLVENAIVHGLEPKLEGGQVCLSAREVGGMLQLRVTDSGLGFQAMRDHGVGLSNVRERLRLLYGSRASLSIASLEPIGTEATIEIPTDVSNHAA